MLKELVEYIVKKLVDKPESVSVSEISGEQATIIESVSYTHLTLPTN